MFPSHSLPVIQTSAAISKAVYFEVIETDISFLISPNNRGWEHYLKAQFSFVYRRQYNRLSAPPLHSDVQDWWGGGGEPAPRFSPLIEIPDYCGNNVPSITQLLHNASQRGPVTHHVITLKCVSYCARCALDCQFYRHFLITDRWWL